jgi:transcriptional regulator with XRE-family HTH domain
VADDDPFGGGESTSLQPAFSVNGFSKTGPKRTRTQREGDYAEIARLDRRGWTQEQIAGQLGLSRAQVGFDLQKIRRRYVEQANVNAGEKIGELLASYRDVRAAAWSRWETTSDPRHLYIVLNTYEHERKLLGLDQLSAADSSPSRAWSRWQTRS